MRVLHVVETYPPYKGGMSEVVRQISERLVMFGHKVTVATSFHPDRQDVEVKGVAIRQFRISGNSVYGIKGDTDQYLDFLKNNQFDVITVFAAQQWSCDLLLDNIELLSGKKVFVPTGFSGLNDKAFGNYFEKMKYSLKCFDQTVFLSKRYQDFLFSAPYVKEKFKVIPNAADEREFNSLATLNIKQQLGVPSDANLLLHVGSFTGLKGHYEAIKVLEKSKRENTYLVLNGNEVLFKDSFKSRVKRRINKNYSLCQLKKILKGTKLEKRVVFSNLSRKELVSLFKEADLLVFPSKVECSPVVIFEAAAASLPAFVSEAGNSAEILEWLGGGWLMPTKGIKKGQVYIDTSKSADLLNQILSDTSRLEQVGESIRKAWQAQFTWDRIAKNYESLYIEMLGGEN